LDPLFVLSKEISVERETILVIEDNPLNLEIAVFLLEEAGFNIFSAEDAEQGIEIAQHSPVDLILMDLHLPGMDGFEATHLLKSDPHLRSVPIVAFTALCTADDQEKARLNGSNGLICKPINVGTFADTVDGYLRQYKD
jgi:two-component system cell cycle response regulator DivK